jgi:hypothetical protein
MANMGCGLCDGNGSLTLLCVCEADKTFEWKFRECPLCESSAARKNPLPLGVVFAAPGTTECSLRALGYIQVDEQHPRYAVG